MALPTLAEEIEKSPFTDLTVKCKDKQFKVHRVIICRKSEVLMKALVGNFIVGAVIAGILFNANA